LPNYRREKMITTQNAVGTMIWNDIDDACVDWDYIDGLNLTWGEWDALSGMPAPPTQVSAGVLIWKAIDDACVDWDYIDGLNLTWNEWDALSGIPTPPVPVSAGTLIWNLIDMPGVDWDYLDGLNFTWDEWDALANFPPRPVPVGTGKLQWDMTDEAGKDWDYIDALDITWDEWDALPCFPRYDRKQQTELDVKTGRKALIALNGEGINILKPFKMAVEYDTATRALTSFAAQVPGAHTGRGAIAGTDLAITEREGGKLKFASAKDIPLGLEWSGMLTLMEFKAAKTGKTTITFR
jgi:hypothetical protein